MPKLNVLVAGSTGYIGIQLIKLLVKHNNVDIKYLCGKTSVGRNISNFSKVSANSALYNDLKSKHIAHGNPAKQQKLNLY